MTKTGYVIRLFFLVQTIALAAEPTGVAERAALPPSYKVLRFDESYLYLSDPVRRSDLIDSIKYIPLRAGDPSWYLTMGGELRERFEAVHNPDFGIDASHDSYWLQRVTLFSDLHLGDRVRVFAEGISGLIAGEETPAPPPQDDPSICNSPFSMSLLISMERNDSIFAWVALA